MSALVYEITMFNDKKVCIFVDGENLRHSIGDLFPRFLRSSYLPKADWSKFFDWIAREVVESDVDRIRTYWYVVQNIDFTPFNLNSARKDRTLLMKILLRDSTMAKLIDETAQGKRRELIEEKTDELQELQRTMEKRFSGWINVQNEIERRHIAIEFRRAGSIRYDLFHKELGSEKAVDVKLATDLIQLRNIYDIAVIVSGDQDYVPAVDAIKDSGKRTVNVAFLTERGRLLPGGARRLNQSTDCSVVLKYSDVKSYLSL